MVDEYQRTSDFRVLAAGNCVELDSGKCFLWNPAKGQSEIAGLNAFETKRALIPRPLTLHAKTPGLPIFVCGRFNRAEPGDEVLRRRQGATYRALRIDGEGRLVGAVCIGDSQGAYALEQAISRGQVLSPDLRATGAVEPVVESLTPPDESDCYLKPNWVCQMCGYNAEGAEPPEICPVCGVGRDQFIAA